MSRGSEKCCLYVEHARTVNMVSLSSRGLSLGTFGRNSPLNLRSFDFALSLHTFAFIADMGVIGISIRKTFLLERDTLGATWWLGSFGL